MHSSTVLFRLRIVVAVVMFATACAICSKAYAGKPKEKIVRDVINVLDFGAKGDGETDDTDALQKAIFEGIRRGSGVYLPRGTYMVSKTLKIPLRSYSHKAAFRMTGEWAVIKAAAKMETVIFVDIGAFLTIKRLIINGNKKALHGFKGFKIAVRAALIEQVTVMNCVSHGFVLEKCVGSAFRSCSSNGNGGDGWMITDSNAAVFDTCMGCNNKGNGFTITSKDFSGGCILNSTWAEQNKGHGIVVENTTSPVTITGGWIEGNRRDGIRVSTVGVCVKNMHITGLGNGNSWAIHLLKGARGCTVQTNNMVSGGGDFDYARVKIDTGVTGNALEPNYRNGSLLKVLEGPPAFAHDTVFVKIGKNLVANGGFEKPGDWNRPYSKPVTNEQSDEKAYKGKFSRKIVTNGLGGAIQRTKLVKGKRYRLSGWIYVVTGRADLAAHNGNGLVYNICVTSKPKWTFKTMDFTAIKTSGYVALKGATSKTTSYYDEIELYEIVPK